MTARARNGRFTAERTTETVTTETTITERVTIEPAPPPMALPGDPAPVFARLLRCPPEDARWAHPGFIADEAARAAAQAPAEVPAWPDDDPPAVRVPYPALAEDTLAHEFTGTDRERLQLALDSGYLP